MKDENNKVSVKIAYVAMFKFLENEYNLTQSDDIGGLLGGMSLLEDGDTADPAAWSDWLKAIDEACSDNCDIKLKILPSQRP